MITKINNKNWVKVFMAGVFSYLLPLTSYLFTSCSDMLETDSSRQVFDPDMNAKTDSVYYALGILQAMQQMADQYVFQGEMRGDLVQTTPYTDKNLRQLADFSATTTNKYDSAYVYYRVINNCNYYIAHRDSTLRTGATYVAMPEYVAVKAIRAWTYMQLARVYGKVPFYTEPLTQISQIDNSNFPELDLSGIVAALAPDLEQYVGYNTKGEYLGYTLPSYGGSTPTSSAFYTSNIFLPVDVVLGDMYLETEQFGKAAQHYVTYLTQVSSDPYTDYMETYTSRSRFGTADDLPGDWDPQRNGSLRTTAYWSQIFSSNLDLISYIPMNTNSRRGVITELPEAFGYDYYSNEPDYIDEVQLIPSKDYLTLSESQDYYYISTASTSSETVVNAAKLGDTRYNSILHEEIEGDSIKSWMMKYSNEPCIRLYRNTTVLLHLAEAFNRLGLYDAAFAILKDGIHEYLPHALYMRPETVDLLKTVYPLLSEANISKFDRNQSSAFYGVHNHGTGLSRDVSGTVYMPGLSPYQFEPVVLQKMQEIAETYNVNIGSTDQDIINAVEDLLCDEYALELAFEGSRFYDLCRLARHKNASSPYGANFGGQWLAKKLAFKNPVKDLTNESNWYLPFK